MKKIYSIVLLLMVASSYCSYSQTNNFLLAMNLRTNISLQDTNPTPVQTVIYFNLNGSDGLGMFDVPYLGGIGTGFFSYVAPNAYSINEMGAFTYDRIIRLGLMFPTNPGASRISASDNPGYIGTSSLILEDTTLNIFHDLRANPDYNVILNSGNYFNRFKLHLGPPATVTYTSDCTSSNLVLTNNSELPVSYFVLNSNLDTIFSGANLATDTIVNSVEPGVHYVTFNRGLYSSTDTINVIGGILSIDLGLPQTQCESTITLDAGNEGSTYLWNTSETTQTITISTTSTYSVTVISPEGCSASTNVLVTINSNPLINLGADITQCGGTVSLDAQNIGQSFIWSNQSTAQTLTTTTSGTYYVTVTDDNGCIGSDSINVSILDLTISGELLTSSNIVDVLDSLDVTFNLNLIGGVADSIVWNLGDGNMHYDSISVNHFFNTEGEYTVTATIYNNSCSLVLQTTIIVSNTTNNNLTYKTPFNIKLLENKLIEISNVSATKNIQVDIFSIDGKLISTEYETAIQNSRTLIPINENLMSGLYLIKVKTNNFEITKKVIIAKN